MKLGPFLASAVATALLIACLWAVDDYTASNDYCESCHVHPQATTSWEKGPHVATSSGIRADCVDCHLPPSGLSRITEKAKAGYRDVKGYYFGDPSSIDWEKRSGLEFATEYTFDSGCLDCHVDLFPVGASIKAVDAHIHYEKNRDQLSCLNCHLDTGHLQSQPAEEVSFEPPETVVNRFPSVSALDPGAFADYTEVIPGTEVAFEMVALEGGEFLLGSPPEDPFRNSDEGPQRRVAVSSFWMGKTEVSWQEFEVFYAETATRGKNESERGGEALVGPTPPYGSPDQGWGKGERPAITMTHFAAQKYCEWLSQITGRRYRLPTEAEWEYAARAGSPEPFFFEWEQRISGGLGSWLGISSNQPEPPIETLAIYAWFRENSGARTHLRGRKMPTPWGLMDILGNVWEFCADWYAPDAYSRYPADQVIQDPQGPVTGEERVIRGGSFRSRGEELRSAERAATRHDEWLKTDPQNPKSVWWYSDSNDVGFRIVRDREERNHE